MGRPVVLSNGEMLVGLNESGLVHDFYYPYVGQENHTNARSSPHRIGVWVDGDFSWVDSPSWQKTVNFEDEALVGNHTLENKNLGIEIDIRDAVDSEFNAFIRVLQVKNTSDKAKDIRVFIHQVFQIGKNGREDTAFFEPNGNYIYDYKGQIAFIIYGRTSSRHFDQFAVGNYGIEGKSGTYLDAEDGELSGNLVEHGGVDSVLGFNIPLEPGRTENIEYWIAAGDGQQEAEYVHNNILKAGVISRLVKTRHSFTNWLTPAKESTEHLPVDDRAALLRSLLIVKAHIDRRGSVLASSDSSLYNYGRDYYAYCWPRDGAYAVWPLIKLGYKTEPKAFFEFCHQVMHRDGYLQHKFQPDGSVGSTWHPMLREHHRELAIQEDETAIVLYMIAEYVEKNNDAAYFKEKYNSFIKPLTDFMAFYIDQSTGLPHASYDLWEQKFLTTTYTTFVVKNTLRRIAKLAREIMGDDHSARWVVSAEMIEGNINKLFDKKQQYFVKGYLLRDDNSLDYDTTLDISSAYAVFKFGGKSADTFALSQTIAAVENSLMANTPNGGVPRYSGDGYLRANDSLPGNPWFVCTFWLAQYYITIGDKQKAGALLDWAKARIGDSGVMSEQIDPETSAPTGVAPLVWSHAEHINTLLDLAG